MKSIPQNVTVAKSMPHPKIRRIPLADEQWKIATMQFARGQEF
jgi:hypothetical protein